MRKQNRESLSTLRERESYSSSEIKMERGGDNVNTSF